MTVSTLTTYNEAAAGGTVYYFTFRCDDAAWVKVYVGGVLLGAGYTVALNADQAASPGGYVTFSVAATRTVLVQRETPLTQETNYTAYDAFAAETHELALDKGILALQDEARDRADGDAATLAAIPAAVVAGATPLISAAVGVETAARLAADSVESASRIAADQAEAALRASGDAAEAYGRAAADAAIIASGAEPADVGLAPVIATDTVQAVTVNDRAAREVWLEDFGDAGAGDWTSTVNAALAFLHANQGGKLKLGRRGYRVDGQITVPSTTGVLHVYEAANIRIIGQGHSGGAWQQGFPTTGSRLDLRYNDSGAGGGRIFSPGAGTLLFEGVSFCDGGASANTTPFILNTNAKMRVKECSFRGDSYGGLPTAVQLAGDTPLPSVEGMLPESPFQGYGTTIRGCTFDYIGRALHARTWSAGVVFDANLIWQGCGGECPVEIGSNSSNNAYGNVVTNNYIELPNYVYGIKFTGYVSGCFASGNSWYDIGVNGPGLLGLYYFGTGARNNFIIENGAHAGLNTTPVATGPDVAYNTVLHSDGGQTSTFYSAVSAVGALWALGFRGSVNLLDAGKTIGIVGNHGSKALDLTWDDGTGVLDVASFAKTSAVRTDLTLKGSQNNYLNMPGTAGNHIEAGGALAIQAASATILDLGNGDHPQALRVLADGSMSAAGALGVGPVTTSKTTTGRLIHSGQATIPYSASMTPSGTAGSVQAIVATNGSAFTVNAPTGAADGEQITITVYNASGGALGAATWNGSYKMAAWTQPANGTNRAITFVNMDGAWREVSRTPADVTT